MISLTDSMCFAAYTCCLEELAEGTTMILFQERCLSFMRVAKRTNKQSIQGMDFPHIMELNFMVQKFLLYGCNVHFSYEFFQLGISLHS